MPKHYIYTKMKDVGGNDVGWRLDLKDDDDNRYFFIFHSDSFENNLVDHILEYEDRVVIYYISKMNGDMFKQIVTDRYWSITSRETDILCDQEVIANDDFINYFSRNSIGCLARRLCVFSDRIR